MQKLINTALGLAVLALAGALALSIVTRPADPISAQALNAAIEAALDDRLERQPQAPMEVADLDARIEAYLLDNPGILEDVSNALDAERAAAQQEATRATLATMQDAIYNDPANVVLGNPEGDVTLVELFDYNCTYCRQVVPDMLELLAEDPDLKIILKEFPILSQDSVQAARVGVLVNRADVDYADFHTALFSARGTIDGAAALDAAADLGLSRGALERDMQAQDVTRAIERNYATAQELGITGTPTFIIGNEVVPGAVQKQELVTRIANMRACGETRCG